MTRARIHTLLDAPATGEQIERRSFEAIDREIGPHAFPPDEWQVVRRMIHTTGDLALAKAARFSPGAIAAAVFALGAGRPLYVDSNMIRAGLSMARLRAACPAYGPEAIHCHVADGDVALLAEQAAQTRSLFAVRKARPVLDGAICAFGNAPIGLLELNRLILEEGVRPALVVAVPVGFVHVVESKEELMSLGVPYVALEGRRGGSPVAVSVIHALAGLAATKGSSQ